ncbi:MAG TPA: hypothetical protein VF256_05250, partial [Streptosporangiaceae bacterium]
SFTKVTQPWLAQAAKRWAAEQLPQPGRRLCAETIYRALFGGLLGSRTGKLRTGPRQAWPNGWHPGVWSSTRTKPESCTCPQGRAPALL